MKIISWNPASGAKSIDVERCHGVAIGSRSDFAGIVLDGKGIVSPGYPMPHDGGRLQATATMEDEYEGVSATYAAELWILETACEAQLVGSVRPLRTYRQAGAGLADDVVYRFPVYGRRHGVLFYEIGEGATIQVDGYKRRSSGAFDVIALATITATAASGAEHIGGTNEEECFDEIVVTVSTTDSSVWTGEIVFKAFGELGR